LGSFLQDTGRPEEAEPFLLAGLALWKKLDAAPPYVAEAENALALTEATLGRSGDPERVLLSSYQKLHELEGERTSRTKDARRRVYRFYELQHQPEKAEQYRVMERRLSRQMSAGINVRRLSAGNAGFSQASARGSGSPVPDLIVLFE
jgi:hypothetical protein